MRRIDYVLNAKDHIKVLVEEFNLALDCCKCPYDDECDGTNCNCREGLRKYLEEDIEVNESETLQKTLDKVKEPVENEFMEEYKKIVTETMELCVKKNKDYGSSVEDTFEKFGDISYLVRITDKYNRICSLLNREGEVKDESIDDTIRDMANYAFLWLASRNLKENK